MSYHYLLDGYNIVHSMPIQSSKLEDRRHALIRYIEISKPHGSGRNLVTIVFDGKFGFISDVNQSSVIKIVFSQDNSADDVIKEMVESADNSKNIIVVTNDRSIQYAVKACGAQVKSVQEFMQFEKLKQKHAAARGRTKEKLSGSKHLSYTLEAKINAELESLWLKKKKG